MVVEMVDSSVEWMGMWRAVATDYKLELRWVILKEKSLVECLAVTLVDSKDALSAALRVAEKGDEAVEAMAYDTVAVMVAKMVS